MIPLIVVGVAINVVLAAMTVFVFIHTEFKRIGSVIALFMMSAILLIWTVQTVHILKVYQG